MSSKLDILQSVIDDCQHVQFEHYSLMFRTKSGYFDFDVVRDGLKKEMNVCMDFFQISSVLAILS